MTQQEIIEGNKLIAEFMGIKLDFWNRRWFVSTYSNMKYHSSFDWLMEVVEKIEDTHMAHVCMFNKSCWIEFYGVHNDPCKFSRADKDFITNVWNTCVAFIEWYNQDKS